MTQDEEAEYYGISPETLRIFEFISDLKNAHLFTVEAALEAFKHIKVKDGDNEL